MNTNRTNVNNFKVVKKMNRTGVEIRIGDYSNDSFLKKEQTI